MYFNSVGSRAQGYKRQKILFFSFPVKELEIPRKLHDLTEMDGWELDTKKMKVIGSCGYLGSSKKWGGAVPRCLPKIMSANL
jgi:hypothetical protein